MSTFHNLLNGDIHFFSVLNKMDQSVFGIVCLFLHSQCYSGPSFYSRIGQFVQIEDFVIGHLLIRRKSQEKISTIMLFWEMHHGTLTAIKKHTVLGYLLRASSYYMNTLMGFFTYFFFFCWGLFTWHCEVGLSKVSMYQCFYNLSCLKQHNICN